MPSRLVIAAERCPKTRGSIPPSAQMPFRAALRTTCPSYMAKMPTLLGEPGCFSPVLGLTDRIPRTLSEDISGMRARYPTEKLVARGGQLQRSRPAAGIWQWAPSMRQQGFKPSAEHPVPEGETYSLTDTWIKQMVESFRLSTRGPHASST